MLSQITKSDIGGMLIMSGFPQRNNDLTHGGPCRTRYGCKPSISIGFAFCYVNEYVTKGKYGIKYDCNYPYRDSDTKKYCIEEAAVLFGDLESYVRHSKSQFYDYKVGLVNLGYWYGMKVTNQHFLVSL